MLRRLPPSAAWIGRRTPPRRVALLSWALVLGLLASACAAPSAAPPSPGRVQPPPPSASALAPGVTAVPGLLPFPIEQNVGQAGPGVGFLLRAGAMQVGFGAGGLTYVLGGPGDLAGVGVAGRRPGASEPSGADAPAPRWTVRQELVGAGQALPSGTVGSPTTISYFKGSAEQWLVGVPAFEQVAYAEAWPGIGVTFERGAGGPKSAYHVAAGADPGQIRLLYSGAQVRVDETGALVATTPLGELRESPPVAWQERDGTRVSVQARYQLLGEPQGDEAEYGFALGAYDPALPLVIDPQIAYASFIGGSGADQGRGIVVDQDSNVYLTGFVEAGATFPGSPVGFDKTHNGDRDAFVVKINPAGTALMYATFIGGSGEDIGFSIALGADRSAYIAGLSASTEATFPARSGVGAQAPFDGTFNGGDADAFVAKINPDGTQLVYAGYIGGSGYDQTQAIAVDAAGNAYVAGWTESSEATFPNGNGMASLGALPTIDGTYNGGPVRDAVFGPYDGFVAKVNPTGTNLLYAGYIGGSGDDEAFGIAINAAGNAYVAGRTSSNQNTFPNGSGMGSLRTFNGTYGGGDFDVFVAEVKPDGSGLEYAGYIGGPGTDKGAEIAIDAAGNAYVGGSVEAPLAPALLSNGSGGRVPMFDDTYNGAIDGFLVKLNPLGTALVYAGYIGGSGNDTVVWVTLDAAGKAFVTGYTTSNELTFPNGGGMASVPTFDGTFNGTINKLDPNSVHSDGFLAKVKLDGTGLEYAGYLGGNGVPVDALLSLETSIGVAVDQAGNAYVTGRTNSRLPIGSSEITFPDGLGMSGLPTFDNTYGGGTTDAFVVKVTPNATCALAGRQASAVPNLAYNAYLYAYYDYLITGNPNSLNAAVYAYQAYTVSQAGSQAHAIKDYATAKIRFNEAITWAYYGYQSAYASNTSTNSDLAYYAFLYGYYTVAYEGQALTSC